MVLHIHIEFHHLIDVEWIDAAGDGHAHGVAGEIAHAAIGEEGRKLLEDFALLRRLNIAFNREHAFAADLVEEFVHHFERVEVARLVEAGMAEDGLQSC